MFAAALANWISVALGGVDVLDDGDQPALTTLFTNAIAAVISAAISAIPAPTAIDYYWTIPAACSIGVGQPNQALVTTHLPGAMPDANYQVFFTANGLTSPSSMSVSVSNSLPTTTIGDLILHVTQIMQNGGGGVTPDIYCHAHHN
jgi:hypothetical protein